MLVLSRRLSQKIVLPTLDLSVQIVSIKPGVVRLGIEAPDHISVFREELLDKDDFQPPSAVPPAPSVADELMHILNNRLNTSEVGLALLRRQLDLGLTREMADTLAKLQDNLQTLKDRVERIQMDAPSPAVYVRRRALVVEDDRNECELLAGFLRLAGLDVQTAGDGADALDYLHQKGKPDVLLMDMMMPRCDGPTTVRTIRRNPAYDGLRIIGVTGASVEQFGLAEGPGGIDRWFRKPVNPEALLRELTREPNPASAEGGSSAASNEP
jgi:carbon storage regulator CsrA